MLHLCYGVIEAQSGGNPWCNSLFPPLTMPPHGASLPRIYNSNNRRKSRYDTKCVHTEAVDSGVSNHHARGRFGVRKLGAYRRAYAGAHGHVADDDRR